MELDALTLAPPSVEAGESVKSVTVIAGAASARIGAASCRAKTVRSTILLIPTDVFPRVSSALGGRTDVLEALRAPMLYFQPVPQNEMMKRLLWSGLIAAIGAIATIAANRVATAVWRRLYDEDPPD